MLQILVVNILINLQLNNLVYSKSCQHAQIHIYTDSIRGMLEEMIHSLGKRGHCCGDLGGDMIRAAAGPQHQFDLVQEL